MIVVFYFFKTWSLCVAFFFFFAFPEELPAYMYFYIPLLRLDPRGEGGEKKIISFKHPLLFFLEKALYKVYGHSRPIPHRF